MSPPARANRSPTIVGAQPGALERFLTGSDRITRLVDQIERVVKSTSSTP